MSDIKTLEAKRKIITLTRNNGYTDAIKLFHKFFSAENPAEVEFISSFFLELNRLNLFEAGYQLLADTAGWHQGDPDHLVLKENAAKLYVDSLVLSGNNALFEREEKHRQFEESLQRSDALSRERMRAENEKILIVITRRALENFEKAREIEPGNAIALIGIQKCCLYLGETEKLAEVEAAIAKKNQVRQTELFEKQTLEESRETNFSSFVPREVDIEESNFTEVKQLLAQKKYDDLIKKVDFLHLSHKISVPMLLLKIKALTELRRFKEVDTTIFECERQNANFEEVKDEKNNINELKYRLLTKASDIYLKKAVSLGPSLGNGHFQKARVSIQKALELNPENLELLDQLYTTLKYLGKDDEALRTKAAIYTLNKSFSTTFDTGSSSSLCFIASFAYADQPQNVDEFRWFRRELLLSSLFGRYLNSIYVKISPEITTRAAAYPLARPVFRILLSLPLFIVRILKYLMKFNGAENTRT